VHLDEFVHHPAVEFRRRHGRLGDARDEVQDLIGEKGAYGAVRLAGIAGDDGC